jgi:osmoprotectant transport system permease protein
MRAGRRRPGGHGFRCRGFAAALALALSTLLLCPCRAAEPLRIGSKRFTESTILGEILLQTAAPIGPAVHIPSMGNTAILAAALRSGSIDLYPEYLGTIELEILHHAHAGATLAQIDAELAREGLGVAIPLGFENSYGIGVRADTARTLGLRTISALAAQPQLRAGLSHEFLGRADGWPGLARRYGLHPQVDGLDHGLAFEALAQGRVDLIDIYTTDAKIARYGIAVLEDDRGYFPRYDAVVLYRRDAVLRYPAAWRALARLQGRIDAARMIALNAQAETGHQSAAEIARGFLATLAAGSAASSMALPTASSASSSTTTAHAAGFADRLFGPDLWPLTIEHLRLVAAAVLLATAVGIPLGVLAARLRRAGPFILAAVSALQTIPALALLAALIPLLGAIGAAPTLVALFLFALLPIVRNTTVGLHAVAPSLREAATALGARPAACLWLVELPLAAPVIVAGIRTAAVISVGTATIGAFVGAGGYGQRIAIGLALNDNSMLLAGALPAAALALLLEFVFSMAERRMRR